MRPRRFALRGFTLVELLVALFALSLLAVLSWRGLDGMVRARQQTEERADEVHALQVGLAQWRTDLDALVQLPQFTALEWNGRVLRLTRQSATAQAEGVVVVGWSRRTEAGASRWMRWQSPPLTTRGQVEQAWTRADAWAQEQAGGDNGSAVAVTGLQDWQVFFFRGNAWTNPLSSDASQEQEAGPGGRPAPVSRTAQLPDGVRIILTLSGGQAISGDLVNDWVRPTVGGGKSS
ncbi:prepilin-type N-terminal cleavage/methylation domain-containing protein [Ramlibacter tataouinensis]|uniref:PulJ/GspJ family protein n=1 Tax=Ramlibacter tataouinensis TaxID=94132 RepID=UPI0022F3CF34|nr:prepilin-type N-terminal cleavage/methylation domain-containing protein [Ramlibacter tataouinensis]WBY03809.1 prepilin-type N-terminal cleavage/methylation domain-containing protein [Ramlibacter tataouinensis]